MGTWGTAPWDNDAAADWYAGLFEETKLAKYVAETLSREVDDDSYEEVRAAAAIVLMLGRNYIWPHEEFIPHLRLTKQKLEEVRAEFEANDYTEFAEAVALEIEELGARLQRYSGNGESPPKSTRPWWKFWG